MRAEWPKAERASPVPSRDYAPVVLITENTDSSGSEGKQLCICRRQPEPACSQHAQDMTVRKERRVAFRVEGAVDDGACALPDFLNRFAVRHAVAEQVPTRPLALDFLGG